MKMIIGSKVRIKDVKNGIIGLTDSKPDSSIKGMIGILGRSDLEEMGEPDIVYIGEDLDECEFIKNLDLELIVTANEMLHEYV